jgi:hypothetical protein
MSVMLSLLRDVMCWIGDGSARGILADMPHGHVRTINIPRTSGASSTAVRACLVRNNLSSH